MENQIHRVEMNMMEAEHIKKKYRIIQSNLLEDSVAFESTLMKIEEAITTQESEMMHLKVRTGAQVMCETTDSQAGRQADRWTDRQMDRQTDRLTDRLTGRQTDT